jgi:hypothetical protein
VIVIFVLAFLLSAKSDSTSETNLPVITVLIEDTRFVQQNVTQQIQAILKAYDIRHTQFLKAYVLQDKFRFVIANFSLDYSVLSSQLDNDTPVDSVVTSIDSLLFQSNESALFDMVNDITLFMASYEGKNSTKSLLLVLTIQFVWLLQVELTHQGSYLLRKFC